MLGYVVAFRPEMKVRESELYRAYYCGVCRSIGRRYGQLPRMILSYDAAFLAVLLDSFYEDREKLEKKRCFVHPHKKNPVAESPAIDFSADVMLMLAWYKALDDIHDEGSRKAFLFSEAIKRHVAKIREKRGRLCEGIEKYLEDLRKLEDEKCDSIDMAGEAFAKIMELVFTEGLEEIYRAGGEPDHLDIEREKKILRTAGYHLGKWIYLIDAADDIYDNIRDGAYNPLLLRYRYKDGEGGDAFKDRIHESVERYLLTCLAQIGNAAELADIRKNRGLLENIIYVGLLTKTEEILGKRETVEQQA